MLTHKQLDQAPVPHVTDDTSLIVADGCARPETEDHAIATHGTCPSDAQDDSAISDQHAQENVDAADPATKANCVHAPGRPHMNLLQLATQSLVSMSSTTVSEPSPSHRYHPQQLPLDRVKVPPVQGIDNPQATGPQQLIPTSSATPLSAVHLSGRHGSSEAQSTGADTEGAVLHVSSRQPAAHNVHHAALEAHDGDIQCMRRLPVVGTAH
jgi:hypothetical protein